VKGKILTELWQMVGGKGALRCVVGIGIALGVCSCASDVANRYYGGVRYSARPVEDVEVLYAAPQRPYEVIADFQSRSESIKSVRQKAALIGADAVIVARLGGKYRSAEEWANQRHDNDDYTHIIGTAIKYNGPP
jgi:hypothetical protein